MKRFITYLLSLGCMAMLLSSCEDKIDVTLPQGETLLVVDGWITTDTAPYTIHLSTTAPYFDNKETPRVQGAQVIIRDNEGFTDTLKEVSPGVYQTKKLQGKLGNTYTLFIDNALGENYIANTQINRMPPIDSLSSSFKDKTGTEYDGYYVNYFGPEPIGVGDYYRFQIVVNDILLNKPSDIWRISSDELVDGNYISGWQPNDKPFKQGDKVTVIGSSITQDAYYFFTEMATQVNNGGMFSNPPANVRTNVFNRNPNSKKKAVGYFGGSAVSKKTIIIQ